MCIKNLTNKNTQGLVYKSSTCSQVAQPIYVGLVSWMYDGELEDMHDELFVASDPTVKNDRLWHDKYSLRKSMIPNFITREQANRVRIVSKNRIELLENRITEENC